MTSYIKQIREYPNIRLEENNRVSFDCSDDLFIRLARSVYMKEIWMQIKNESPQKYLHYTGDKYYRKLETNYTSVCYSQSSSILELIHTMRPEKCIMYMNAGVVGQSLYISFNGRSKRLRINVPRQALKKNSLSRVFSKTVSYEKNFYQIQDESKLKDMVSSQENHIGLYTNQL